MYNNISLYTIREREYELRAEFELEWEKVISQCSRPDWTVLLDSEDKLVVTIIDDISL